MEKPTVLHLECSSDSTIKFSSPLNIQDRYLSAASIIGRLICFDEAVEGVEKRRRLFLCCDVIDGVWVNSIKLPALLELYRNAKGFIQNTANNIKVHVSRPKIHSVRLYIADESGEVCSLKDAWLSCTLVVSDTL